MNIRARAYPFLGALLTIACAASLLSLQAAGAAPATTAPRASAMGHAAKISLSLNAAANASRRADRTLVSNARATGVCLLAHPRGCTREKRSVQRAGMRLTAAEARLAALANSGAGRGARASAVGVPKLSVAGQTLNWTAVSGVHTYLGVRHIPGRGYEFAVINATTFTPPPVLGTTVSYSVRAAVDGSSWATPVSIAYPAQTVNTKAAPQITVSGQTLSWNRIGDVNTYVGVRQLPGQEYQFEVINGASATPPVVPGTSVLYSVRTDVEGSAWAAPVTLSYPAEKTSSSTGSGTGGGSTGSGTTESPKTEPPKTEEPKTEPPKTEPPKTEEPPHTEEPPKTEETPASAFEPGLNAGTNMNLDVNGSVQLGAKIVRIAFESNVTAAQMEPVIAGYAAKNIRVLPLFSFYGSMPTPTQARNLANWAKTYGPGGAYWSSHPTNPEPIQAIEFGNETSYGYQYGNEEATTPAYAARAETYAIRFKEAAEAITSTGIKVGLLAQADNWTGNWVKSMYHAVPSLSSYVAGWTIHPYGVGWQTRMQDLINQTAAQGAPATIPIDITEWGVATDNGRCLNDNYGLNKCMSYNEAASTVTNTVSEMRKMLGNRLHMFLLYSVRDQAPTGTSGEREAYFGALQKELQPKGAYTTAVQALLASH
ncbi:MAG TPA: hypothetical protein VK252_02345 [Solirubrobacteraceae bacterium]|nr:hypothetical protein [Solirubrobacteraceae bacterium]